MNLPSDKKLVSIAVAISVIIAIIGIQYALELKSSSTPHTFSRTVDWRHIHGLGIDPIDPTILYIATHGDFYHSHDGNPPFKVDIVRADYMAFNAPATAGIPLYASGHPASGGNTGLIKSIDGGQSWEIVSKVLEPPVDFHAMSVSKSDPNIIIGFDSGARGLFKTTDAGKTWDTLQYPDYITSLAISPVDSQIVFAGTGKGIFQSNDGANSWTLIDEYTGVAILALAFNDDQTLYASNQFGLSRSSDFGKSWENLDNPGLTITTIAIDTQNKIIYVAGYSSDGFQEVYRSKNDGKDWELIGTNKGL